MIPDWVCVYSTDKAYHAEVLKSFLEENGIQSIIMNKQDSVYLFGEIELFVSTEDTFLAKQLILSFKSE